MDCNTGTSTIASRISPRPDISCFMPCDFAPGLSLPYPSKRLTTPQTPSSAPIRQMTDLRTVHAVLMKEEVIDFTCSGKSLCCECCTHDAERGGIENCLFRKSASLCKSLVLRLAVCCSSTRCYNSFVFHFYLLQSVRQYHTRNARQMRSQIFRQIKQKTE